MTPMDKQKAAEFLDLAGDFLGSGYKSEQKDYKFNDEPLEASGRVSEAILQTSATQNKDFGLDSIEKIAAEIKACKNCSLCEKRLNAAPGEGVSEPLVMVIGEGPGEDEDKQGRPFVGKAGQLLDKMLDSIGLSRTKNAFIANVVKCRPPNNRDPYPEETASCANFLERQITILKPKFILVAGKVSAHSLLKTSESIGKLRGKVYDLHVGSDTFPLLVTYHPAALLRNEEYKRPTWEDLKLLKSKLTGE